MAERLSTGFANALNTVGSVKDIMQDGTIHIYSGLQPASADLAETGDLLLIITLASGAFTPGVALNGINMGLSVDGVLAKAVAEVWSGNGLALAGAGTLAQWFRWYANAVGTGDSTTAIRVDGAIGVSSSYEMQMSNPIITENGPTVISSFNYTTPLA